MSTPRMRRHLAGPFPLALLACAALLASPPPAGAAGCCVKDGACIPTDDPKECPRDTHYQLGFCTREGKCEPSIGGPSIEPAPFEPRPGEIRLAAAKPAPPRTIPAPSDVAAPPAGAETTPSGLASRVLAKGTGSEHPTATDSVKVHYSGWTTDGKMFDSSVTRGNPLVFPLNGVISGWREGVQLMVVGEKRRLWIPAKLAYDGMPGKPQGMLVFDVELLEIAKPSSPAPAPAT